MAVLVPSDGSACFGASRAVSGGALCGGMAAWLGMASLRGCLGNYVVGLSLIIWNPGAIDREGTRKMTSQHGTKGNGGGDYVGIVSSMGSVGVYSFTKHRMRVSVV
jgi:hypothetical protein